MEVAVYYGVVAWLSSWLVDLIVIVARGPVMIDPILKLVIVAVCLVLILRTGYDHGWFWAR